MMIDINPEKCTGCGACIQRCPVKCISWTVKDLGFRYPCVNKELCINCGQCNMVCPIGDKADKPLMQKMYAIVNTDEQSLMESTSGGAFTAIAESVIEKGGVVFGVTMTGDFVVRHIQVDSKDDLTMLRGSKYVQSNTEETFLQVEKILKTGRLVLYSGTPCQIAGLKGFLKHQYNNLITVDVICHGVGSQAYFDKFISYMKEKYPDLCALRFRSKKYGWFCGGGIRGMKNDYPFYYYDWYYYDYFLSGEIYRKSCYTCPYANLDRQADITIGDFWGVEALHLGINTDRGCSLVIVNTEKGRSIMNDVKKIERVEVSASDAIRKNAQLSQPSEFKLVREQRNVEFQTMLGRDIQKIYLCSHRFERIKGKIKSMLPYTLRIKLRSIIR